jgi:hypothetical protein
LDLVGFLTLEVIVGEVLAWSLPFVCFGLVKPGEVLVPVVVVVVVDDELGAGDLVVVVEGEVVVEGVVVVTVGLGVGVVEV